MGSRKFFVTTAIDYVNARPGLHHAYEKTGADALARFHRQRGAEVFFLTGTDENATKNEQAAQRAGLSTQAFVDANAAEFRRLCDTWLISHDRFIRTSVDRDHIAGVQEFVRRWVANGDVYRSTYEGLYCVGCEAFYDEDEIADGRCPSDHAPEQIQRVREENHFFRLSRYADALRRLYAERPGFIEPESRRNEVLAFVERGLRDVSVSRGRSLEWGIPWPGEPGHTVYVWFDALINYVTGVGFGTDEASFAKWWPCDVHVIGKDISRFHCIFWPAMLLSAGVALPDRVFVHGFLENRSGRLSKSSGNTIDPFEFAGTYGVDAARYLVLREAPFEKDSPISDEQFAARYTADLANGLGNLVSRTLAMIERYGGGAVPAPAEGPSERAVREAAEAALRDHDAAAERLRFADALAAVFRLVDEANRHFQRTQPWQAAKDPARAGEVGAALYAGAEAVRIAAYLLAPYTPGTSARIAAALGVEAPESARFTDVARWGVLAEGHRTTTVEALFPRLGAPSAVA